MRLWAATNPRASTTTRARDVRWRQDTAAMVEYVVVNLMDWWDKAMPLFRQHWAESGFGFEFNPDRVAYGRLCGSGLLFTVLALEDGELLGYCTFVIAPHLHNRSVVCASHDALYVLPERRGGVVSARLMSVAEAEAKARGAMRFVWRPRHGTALSGALERRGYEPLDAAFCKEL